MKSQIFPINRFSYIVLFFLFISNFAFASTPLIDAVRFGTLEDVKKVVQTGTKVDEKDETGTDALHYAEFSGDKAKLLVLLQTGQISKNSILEEISYLCNLQIKFPSEEGDHRIDDIISFFGEHLRELQ